MQGGIVIKNGRPKLGQRAEVTRSFSMKLNLGNYESADFFCSEKVECAPEDAEAASEAVYNFCRKQVMKSINEFQVEKVRKEAMQAQRRTA